MSLDTLSKTEFIELLRKDYFHNSDSPYGLEQRVAFIEQLMSFLNLTPNREQLAYLICNKPRVLTEACAGAGKTTISILRSVTMNMFGDTNARKTLMLTYTTKATKDLERKLTELNAKLSSVDFKGLKLDCAIKVMTLHGFFHELIYEYNDMLGIKMFNGGMESSNRLKIMEQNQCYFSMQDVITTLISHGHKDIKTYQSLPRQLHSLYCQIKEKDVYNRPEEWCKCSSFKEVSSTPLTEIIKIYEVYDKVKKASQTIELCEFANKAQELLANPVILERWRGLYTNYLVDEFQDVTEAQSKCLRMIVNGSEGLHLAAIGDGDQAIYGFRGAHSNGCFNFPKEYSTGNPDDLAICYMTLNRRCPRVVLDNSKKIIETLNVRNPKDLNTNKEGGYFELIKVEDYQLEAEKVYSILRKMSLSDMQDTVITYRSKKSARFVKDYLQSRGIRCKCNENIEDVFENTLSNCFAFLNNPASMELTKANLFKMVPKSSQYTKDVIAKITQNETAARKAFKPPKYFYDLDWSNSGDPSSPIPPETFYAEIDMLKRMSMCVTDSVNVETLKNPNIIYMDFLTPLLLHNYIKKYYLNWQDKRMNSEGGENIFDGSGNILDEYCQSVYKRYCVRKTYRDFRQAELARQEIIDNSQKVVNLSTFHSLKGLEFKNVILIDMRDNIFPGYELTLASEFGADFIKEADDEAKRLLYVAMTRSKENLYIISRNRNPFRYESYLTQENTQDDIKMEQEIGTFSTAEFTDLFSSTFNPSSNEDPLEQGLPWEVSSEELNPNPIVEEEAQQDGLFGVGNAFDRWMNS